jgi:nucleotide-binding universal stress UspA family protein
MKNILVSIDFEKQTYVLLEQAAAFAKKFGAKIWLIHISAPDPDFIGYDVGPQNVRDVRNEELRVEHNEIEKFAAALREDGIDASGFLIEGQTVGTILNQIKKLNIDLVILGHHKHNYFYKALMGNTDIAVVNRSTVPVLVIPLTEKDADVVVDSRMLAVGN